MTTTPSSPSSLKRFTRRAMLTAIASAAGSLVAASIATAEEKKSSLDYTVVKRGTGPSAEIGDLVGIRFKGTYNGVVFDNLFNETNPYFYRAGSGVILKVSCLLLLLLPSEQFLQTWRALQSTAVG